MEIYESILDCIGDTPLVALDRFAPPNAGRGRVFGKLELLNPYSVKDRPAATMILEAEKRGDIAAGKTTIIEATSGNTGVEIARARLAPACFRVSVACAHLYDVQSAKKAGFIDEVCSIDELLDHSCRGAEQLETLDFTAYRETKARVCGPLYLSVAEAIKVDFSLAPL